MRQNNVAKKVASLGIMLALAMALSFLEQLIPALPGLPPGSKLGLSNIVIMYALFYMNKSSAFTLAFLKSFFVFLTRGVTAGFLSLSGGLSSLGIIVLLSFLFGDKISYLLLSVFGAIFHNLGQLIAARFIFQQNIVLFYLPLLLVSGVVFGTITGLLLNITLPALKRFSQRSDTK